MSAKILYFAPPISDEIESCHFRVPRIVFEDVDPPAAAPPPTTDFTDINDD